MVALEMAAETTGQTAGQLSIARHWRRRRSSRRELYGYPWLSSTRRSDARIVKGRAKAFIELDQSAKAGA
jgi:hypothetical protein